MTWELVILSRQPTSSRASGGGIEEAARIAIDAAGIAVAKPSTADVSHQELLIEGRENSRFL
jgi:bifunctional ADP-heptose synthase (sugar kinase/adenylyltransferase)